jgi:cyclase
MLKTRVIPCLLLQGHGLVKTVQFKNPRYIGDPLNSVRIFNDKEVDELIFLDISATTEKREPNFDLVKAIASEAFMPFGYGGGVSTSEHVRKLIHLGVEKVVINSQAVENPSFIYEASCLSGSQSIVVSIDVKKTLFGKYVVMTHGGMHNTGLEPVGFAKRMQEMGAGEIFLNSIDRDGTMKGYDVDLIQRVASAVSIPVVACGGAATSHDFVLAVRDGGASAVAAGSMFVFHGKHKAVLITYPPISELERIL